MPFKTRYGSHYHMTQGCHGADIPCGTEGLSPCSDCCGGGAGGSGGGTIAVDSEIVGVADVTLDGVSGTLYKLDKLLEPDERRAISELDGVRTFVVAAQYAPELRRTGVFVEDGYAYSIGRASEIADMGAAAMADPASAPEVSLAGGADDQPHAADLSDGRCLEVAAFAAHQRMVDGIRAGLEEAMLGDPDVVEDAFAVSRGLDKLIDACELERIEDGGKRDPYTMNLVSQYVVFATCRECRVGGSEADYCAAHAMDAMSGYRLRLGEHAKADAILAEIRRGIDRTALYPSREYGELAEAGVPIRRVRFLRMAEGAQKTEASLLRQMSPDARAALWQGEAEEWAEMWVDSCSVGGEERDERLCARTYRSLDVARDAAANERFEAFQRSQEKMGLRFGGAYTEEMADELEAAYREAEHKATQRLERRIG